MPCSPPSPSRRADIFWCRTRTNMERIIRRPPKADIWEESREFLPALAAVEDRDPDVVGSDAGVRDYRLAGAAQRCQHHLRERGGRGQSEFPGVRIVVARARESAGFGERDSEYNV